MAEQTVRVRNSESRSYMDCRQQWWWSYVEHLRPKDEAPALGFGDLTHQAMEAYYVKGRKRKGHPAKHFVRIYRKYLEAGNREIYPVKDDPTITAEDLGVEMLENYVAHWGSDDRYEVISSEQTFYVDVYHPKTQKYLYTAVGTADGVWRDLQTGWLILLETKTGQSLSHLGSPLPLDEQSGKYITFMPIYLKAKGIMRADEEVDYVMFNRLKKSFSDTRPVNAEGLSLNQNGSVSKRQPEPLFKREPIHRGAGSRRSIMNRLAHVAVEMTSARAGKVKIIKNPGQHCHWCPFRGMCEVHEQGSDWEAMRDSLYTTWDPYAAHEIALERRH